MLDILKKWILLLISTFFLLPSFAFPQVIVEGSSNISINEKVEPNFKQLYLVFAGPYPASPSSAFGHLFLLIEPQKETAQNPQLWKVINYEANVEGHSGISTLYNGLLGKLEGSFRKIPFYKKMRDYSYAESRDLWLFPLELNQDEKKRFANFLNDRRGQFSQYRFSDKNCATRINELLYHTLGKSYSKPFFVLPQDIFKDKAISPKLSEPLWIEDVEAQLNEVITKFDNSNFRSINVDSLNATEKVHFLKTYEWLYNNNSHKFDENRQKLIRKIRYEVAQEKSDYQFQNLREKEFKVHDPAQIGLGYKYGNNQSNKMVLDFRLGLHDFSDKSYTYPKYDYINLFRVRSLFSTSDFLVDEFWVFHQSSYQPKTKISSSVSWSLGLGGDRFFYKSQSLMAIGLYSSIGKTVDIIKDRWVTSFMLSINPIYLEKETWSLIYNPKIENRIFSTGKIKGFVEVGNPMFLQSRIRFNPKVKFKGVYSIKKNMHLNSRVEYKSRRVQVSLGMSLNFPI